MSRSNVVAAASPPSPDPACHLAPALAVEQFERGSVVFLSETETFVTVNPAAADLLGTLQAAFRENEFTRPAMIDLLLQQYDLDPPAAAGAADRLLADWSACGILVPA